MTNNLEVQSLQAAEKAAGWLVSHMTPEGSCGEASRSLTAHYKSTVLLAWTGRRLEGMRCLEHIRSTFQSSCGHLVSPEPAMEPQYCHLLANYLDAWTAFGAQQLGRYDLTAGLIRYLLTQQSKTGGVPMAGAEVVSPDHCDIGTTCAVGYALLACGQWQEATKAGEFVARVIEDQPGADRLYVVRDGDGNLVKEFPMDKAGFYLVEAKPDGQEYWFLGIAPAFLGKLFLATGEIRFRDAARDYLDFFNRCQPVKQPDYTTGKVGWGAATLYQITGDSTYRDLAHNIMDILVSTQREDGAWLFHGAYPSFEEQPLAVSADLSSEMGMWCQAMVAEMSWQLA